MVAGNVSEFNVVVTAMHCDAGKPFMPDCSRYHEQAQRAIQRTFDDHYDDRRRNLRRSLQDGPDSSDSADSTEIEDYRADTTTDCAELCRSAVDGWCFWATGGVCSSPRRLNRVQGTESVSTLCGHRPQLVQEALEDLGNELPSQDPCRTYFEGPWDTDCFAIE